MAFRTKRCGGSGLVSRLPRDGSTRPYSFMYFGKVTAAFPSLNGSERVEPGPGTIELV